MDIYIPSKPTYYVYMYLREDNTPYYVGKGKDRRLYMNSRTTPKPQDKSRIIIIHDNLTELQSLILERYYIRWFGRKDNNTGILRNLTDGGDGTSGIIPWNIGKTHTQETKQKISSILTGNKNCLGRILSKETKQKISKGQAGKKLVSKEYILTDPFGIEHRIMNLSKFCRDNGLSQPHLCSVSNGKLRHYKGWKCRHI